VTVVQVREKRASTRDMIELAARIKGVTQRHGVPLIINDRLDVALAVGADGVHVGQDDMAATTARALLKGGEAKRSTMLLGVTATNEAQARAAELAGADYVGTSAVFPTDTKRDGGEGYVIGLDAVQRISRATSLPVVAVGGVNETNAHQIIAHGASGVGVVSAIVGADCPRTAAAGLAAAVNAALPKYSSELAAKAAASILLIVLCIARVRVRVRVRDGALRAKSAG
jgi:thiamine-phosphate pyrophosphorylase